ncbi:hypothetical protein ACGFX4_38835 [Kitasatospora sp. NPDC048365]|uniref:hypothetical protein n=1 Tax=Kitasatospora sp. NPDC048365 TaxID=3364050 RepID=UPI0037233865
MLFSLSGRGGQGGRGRRPGRARLVGPGMSSIAPPGTVSLEAYRARKRLGALSAA